MNIGFIYTMKMRLFLIDVAELDRYWCTNFFHSLSVQMLSLYK